MHEQARRKGGKLPTKRIRKLPTKRIRKLSKFDTKKFSLPSYEVLKLMARKTNRKLAEYIRESTLNGKIVRRNNTEMRP